MRKFIDSVKGMVLFVKSNPVESVVLVVMGFTLGALHNYFGL